METIFERVAGLDVHKESIAVCSRRREGASFREEVCEFGTTTSQLRLLATWLKERQVTHVAMESTGVYWKPVWNVLEGGFELLLVNPLDLKQVPGRKSDIRDCQWIAKLLQHGLLRASFVPPAALRELRDLTRHRAQLQDEHTRIANRIHKTLEDANIKLGSVASDILGVSGREMLQALLKGTASPAEMAELARGRMRRQIPALREALEGRVTAHHRFMLTQLLAHLSQLESQVETFNARIQEAIRPFLSREDEERLDAIPGMNRISIENVVAEIGTNMSQFPTAKHLASWAGMCPGNEESAGKRKRTKTTKGNRWVRRALCEAAWAAARTRESYLGAQFRRLVGRRGKKRALVAVGHSILVIVHHLLSHPGTQYKDLGKDFFARLEPERQRRYLVQRLETLGYEVTLELKTA
jgi:transposase